MAEQIKMSDENRNQMMWILASASPRRKELLSQIGLPFEVMVSEADENVGENLPPGELVEKLSHAKAAAVSEKLYAVSSIFGKKNEPADRKDKVAGDIHVAQATIGIIGADTVVYHNGKVLGKPKDEEDAFDMLKSLSGDTHSVFTGVTILLPKKEIVFHSETKVTFDTLSDEEIRTYIESGEPMDKAGAYGIQGLAGAFVTHIEGEYANVVGFPIGEFCHRLRILESP